MLMRNGNKKAKQHTVLYTLVTVMLITTVFVGLVGYLYNKTEEESYDHLHVQTKQIKDDIILQMLSDRENLATMANFAAKLYSDGDDYSLLFDSFKSIGMIEDIGILNPDNTFITKNGVTSTGGALSFEEERKKGAYISGRITDVTNTDYVLIRSAVPIMLKGKVIGVLYGAIKPEKLGARYKNMIEGLNSQLFVYEKSTGDILVDTIQDELTNIEFLKDREYVKGSSFKQLMTTDKGFLAFKSKYKNEVLHLHYSTIEEFDWMIVYGRYDSQVFASTHALTSIIFLTFLAMSIIIAILIIILICSERRVNAAIQCASDVRRVLLEIKEGQDNIDRALSMICKFSKGQVCTYFDLDDEFYNYVAPDCKNEIMSEEDRIYLRGILFHYATEYYNVNPNSVNVLCMQTNKDMQKTSIDTYRFLKAHRIENIVFSATINNSNHIAILAVINSLNINQTKRVEEKIAACFSMAIFNKNYLSNTIRVATTDPLTGVLNRVVYKNDVKEYDEKQPADFSCVYVDVNELHLCNNKFGHAAGDEMLLYIANTLKEAFYGQKIYRMGGDEFLVFCTGVEAQDVKRAVEIVQEQLKPRDYHVAVGISYRTMNTNAEEMVKEAEVRMYEAKAEYYQQKEMTGEYRTHTRAFLQAKTGISEIDTLLSVLQENYSGIYRVSLKTDKAKRILMPAHLKYNEQEDNFSELFAKYVSDTVNADYHRGLMSFMNYDALRQQLIKGMVPTISFGKINGENVVLSVYRLSDDANSVNDTLWVFAKK